MTFAQTSSIIFNENYYYPSSQTCRKNNQIDLQNKINVSKLIEIIRDKAISIVPFGGLLMKDSNTEPTNSLVNTLDKKEDFFDNKFEFSSKDVMLANENYLQKTWLTDEEDEAWEDL